MDKKTPPLPLCMDPNATDEELSADWFSGGEASTPKPLAQLEPEQYLTHRERLVAKHLAKGTALEMIAKEAQLNKEQLEHIINQEKVQYAVKQYEDKKFRGDVHARLEELAEDSVDIMEKVLDSGEVPLAKKESTARWILEKVTGKAAQQVTVEGEVSVGVFLEQLKKMDAKDVTDSAPALGGKTEDGEVIDVDPIAAWVDENV